MADTPRILIIDPDAATLSFLQHTLSKEGYQAFTARSAKEGLIAAWRDRPHMLVIDPALQDMPIDTMISKLRHDQRTENALFIAFSSLRDPLVIQQMIDAGFNEYIAKEPDAIDKLRSSIARLLAQRTARAAQTAAGAPAAATPPQPRKQGKQIVVMSAKGGTGTSSICANLSQMIGRRAQGRSVVVVDLVLPLGSINSIVGYDGPLDVVSVSQMTGAETDVAYFKDHLPVIPRWSFQLLAGAPDPEQSADLNVARVPVMLDTLKAAFDFVVVDIGRSLSRIALPIILSSDQVVMITSVDIATVDLTEAVLHYLREQGLRPPQLYTIINRAVGHEGLSKTEIEQRLGIDIKIVIPYTQANFTLANNQSIPYGEKFPDDAATLSLLQTAQDILQKLPTGGSGLRGL